ncbi:hypothetical protein PFISCL1PPCAC_28231 [Pristionchus fissidentatus]|uniref:Uncharacterized protein n=1 Tax=Pristionchus fissidentatus TaxID=1538716 RepID=A0AAV5WYI0_9BILA|nr:hypothetical protein PFISCL1PPCAC_28231 [Pristionchus fissidentatus]
MDIISEEIAFLNEEFPMLDDARFVWTLAKLSKKNSKEYILREEVIKAEARRKATDIVTQANTFRIVLGYANNLDFFIHPDLAERKRKLDERNRNAKKISNDRRIAHRYWVEARQTMRREIQQKKREEEEEAKRLRECVEGLRHVTLGETDAEDGTWPIGEDVPPPPGFAPLPSHREDTRREKKDEEKKTKNRRVKVIFGRKLTGRPSSEALTYEDGALSAHVERMSKRDKYARELRAMQEEVDRMEAAKRLHDAKERRREEKEKEKEILKEKENEDDDEDGRASPEL